MNTRQNNKLASFIATKAVLEAEPEVADIPGLPAKIAEFSAKVAELHRLGETQEQGIASKMIRRDELLDRMTGSALAVAGVVLAVANEQKLGEIAAEVRLMRSDFEGVRRTRRPWLARRVLQAAREVQPHLEAYGVTAAMVDALEAQIEAALNALAEPRATLADKQAASRGIPVLIAEIDRLLDETIDNLMAPIRLTNRAFYEAYDVAREIVDRRGPRRPRKKEGEAEPPPAAAATAVDAVAGSPGASATQRAA